MSRIQAIEAALAAWRDVERRLAEAVDGEAEGLARKVELHRNEFHRLSAEHMVQWIGKLHEAARDTLEIAARIWESARRSDDDTPHSELNGRSTARPDRPGIS